MSAARDKGGSAALYALSGPGIWAAHFFALYGAASLQCTNTATLTSAAGQFRTVGCVLTGLAIAALAWIILRQPSASPEDLGAGTSFLRRIAPILCCLALLGILWTSVSLVLLQGCAGSP